MFLKCCSPSLYIIVLNIFIPVGQSPHKCVYCDKVKRVVESPTSLGVREVACRLVASPCW